MALQSFWHDRWCGEFPLKDLFNRVYVLAVDKNASFVEYQEQVYGNSMDLLMMIPWLGFSISLMRPK